MSGDIAAILDKLALLDGSLEKWTPVAMRASYLMQSDDGKRVWMDDQSFQRLAAQQPALRASLAAKSDTTEDQEP